MLRGALASVLPARLYIVQGPRSSGRVCLTFDDGPHPEHTVQVLDTLREQGVKATFFILGRNAKEHPHLIRRIAQEGHSMGYHSFTHSDPASTPVSQVIDENHQTDDVLRGIIPHKLRLTRPPYGKLTAGKMWAMWREKLTVVLWNRDPKDFTAKSAQELRDRLAGQNWQSGDIILLHDTLAFTAQLLGELIGKIRSAGLEFATIDQWTGRR